MVSFLIRSWEPSTMRCIPFWCGKEICPSTSNIPSTPTRVPTLNWCTFFSSLASCKLEPFTVSMERCGSVRLFWFVANSISSSAQSKICCILRCFWGEIPGPKNVLKVFGRMIPGWRLTKSSTTKVSKNGMKSHRKRWRWKMAHCWVTENTTKSFWESFAKRSFYTKIFFESVACWKNSFLHLCWQRRPFVASWLVSSHT